MEEEEEVEDSYEGCWKQKTGLVDGGGQRSPVRRDTQEKPVHT